jgi:transglutaminase-like putative cysteine protease
MSLFRPAGIRSFTTSTNVGSVESSRNAERAAAPAGVPMEGGEPAVLYFELDETKPDAPQILARLQALSIYFGRSPYVREYTRRVLPPALGNNNLGGVVRAVFAFVQNNLDYLPDPEGTEWVISPIQLLGQIQSGFKPKGDCDDHVLLLNSMLRSVGIETAVVGVKLYASDRWDHVISSVRLFGQAVDLDPCAKNMMTPAYRERLVSA